jgi:hypothetical protein
MTQRLWGITCFFNPAGSKRRLANYRTFRQALAVPLVTVELAYGPRHELLQADADLLLQLRGSDVMWQKERLLNLALDALPDRCDAVVWLDSDVLFEASDWPDRVLDRLESDVLVQPFRSVTDRGPVATPPRASLTYKVASGSLARDQVATARLRNEWGCAAGLAWGGRREILMRHRLYDAGIVGGGDRAMACAAYGAWEGLERCHQMNENQRRHYLAWAAPFFADVQGRVGYVDGEIAHLWHGRIDKRGYGSRFTGLAPFAFDPFTDIAHDDQGCWRWNSAKAPMHQYVRSYFASRECE